MWPFKSKVKPALNPGQVMLDDGTVIHWADYLPWRLRSAFPVTATDDVSHWRLFTWAAGQSPWTVPIVATRAHTNMPQPNCLPKNHEMLVRSIRASTNVLLEQPVLDWASETSIRYTYRNKLYSEDLLVDLLLGETPVYTRIQENLPFCVDVVTNRESVLKPVRDGLKTGDRVMTCWVHLNGDLKRPLV
jgi:hypothetical protein